MGFVSDEEAREASKKQKALPKQPARRPEYRCGIVKWPIGWRRIFLLGMNRWHGVPWFLRQPRLKLGRSFPWIMQPTLEERGCGCLVKTKAVLLQIRLCWSVFKVLISGIVGSFGKVWRA